MLPLVAFAALVAVAFSAPVINATQAAVNSSGYDVDTAYSQLLLSSAAYSSDPQSCIRSQAQVSSFLVAKTVSVSCDWAGDNCFAYTAVSTSKQAIAVVFRGTTGDLQLIIEILEGLAAPDQSVPSGGMVQDYFYQAYQALEPDLRASVTALRQQYPSYDVWVTGHSLGGSLASIFAALFSNSGDISSPVQYTFGEPRTGNADFAQGHDSFVSNAFRVVHYRDIVPHIPFCHTVGNGCIADATGPYHHGTEVFYDAIDMPVSDSSYEICLGDPVNEDESCSDGLVTREPCIDITTCITYHDTYFDLNVPGLCS